MSQTNMISNPLPIKRIAQYNERVISILTLKNKNLPGRTWKCLSIVVCFLVEVSVIVVKVWANGTCFIHCVLQPLSYT